LKKVGRIRFHLYIEYDEYLRYYQGTASNVRLQADNGQIVVFPANRLQPFIRHDGIQGYFEMTFDENQKFISLQRLGD